MYDCDEIGAWLVELYHRLLLSMLHTLHYGELHQID